MGWVKQSATRQLQIDDKRLSGAAEPSRSLVATMDEVIASDFGFVVGTGRDPGEGRDIMWSVKAMLIPFHGMTACASSPHVVMLD